MNVQFKKLIGVLCATATLVLALGLTSMPDASAAGSSTGCSWSYRGVWGTGGGNSGRSYTYWAVTQTGYISPPESTIPICNQGGFRTEKAVTGVSTVRNRGLSQVPCNWFWTTHTEYVKNPWGPGWYVNSFDSGWAR